MTDQAIEALRAHLKDVKVPDAYSSVYKDECQFSFDSPFSPAGLYTSLSSHLSFGKDQVPLDQKRNPTHRLYLHQKWEKVKKHMDQTQADALPEKMAIGVEGGFQTEEQQYDIVKHNSVVLMPDGIAVPFPNVQLPELIIQAVQKILSHSDAVDQQQLTAWEEDIRESKYARALVQENNGKVVSNDPSTWICEETGDRENLWVNLSDGFIGGGRRNWDGSGGNGSALRHYEAMKAEGKEYPLVVKLGTISAKGADVYSYAPDENDSVLDPLLREHLLHWGIDQLKLEKTEKSMAELQIELNKNWEFDRITESGKELQKVTGPGRIGLRNLGNTCYINSVVQCLFTIPELQTRYVAAAPKIFQEVADPAAHDISAQMAKIGSALLSDRYSVPAGEEKPVNGDVQAGMLKALVGKGHPEFATGNQQDVAEYLEFLLQFLHRGENAGLERLGGTESVRHVKDLFRIGLEDRLECSTSHQVRYKQEEAILLGLNIPMGSASHQDKRQKTGGEAEGEEAKQSVPFTDCLAQYMGEAMIPDFMSPATGVKGPATKRTRIHAFPRYLAVQMRRYQMESDSVKKLDVLVDVPDTLDLEALRGTGLQPGEVELPSDPAPAGPTPNPDIVEQLVNMGFSKNGCERAALATGNTGVEPAMEWVLSHMEDPDFNEPLTAPSASASAGGTVSEESVAMLCSMGFDAAMAERALKATDNNLERATEWIFSHGSDLEPMATEPTETGENAVASGGSSKYRLFAFISHIGRNTGSGHYVCHILKDGKWLLFNDEKVALSDTLPRDVGYLYLFRQE